MAARWTARLVKTGRPTIVAERRQEGMSHVKMIGSSGQLDQN